MVTTPLSAPAHVTGLGLSSGLAFHLPIREEEGPTVRSRDVNRLGMWTPGQSRDLTLDAASTSPIHFSGMNSSWHPGMDQGLSGSEFPMDSGSTRHPPRPCVWLPELVFDSGPVNQRHIRWRFGDLMLRLFPSATLEELETMRSLASRPMRGRWREAGHGGKGGPAEDDAPPVDSMTDGGAGHHQATSARHQEAAAKSDVSGGASKRLTSIRTAAEVLGNVPTASPSSPGREQQIAPGLTAPSAFDPSPSPWISLDWTLPVDDLETVLLRLAASHVATEIGQSRSVEERPFVPLPTQLRAGDVPEWWHKQYEDARQDVVAAKRSMRSRLK